jgi:predicted site-specific integrase-resolvase
MPFYKSAAVAKQLGVRYTQLFSLIRTGRLAPPAKDSSGDYIWLEADVERARQAYEEWSRPRKVCQA